MNNNLVVNAIRELAEGGNEFTAWNLTNKMKTIVTFWSHEMSRQVMDSLFNDRDMVNAILGDVVVTRELKNVNNGGPQAFHYTIKSAKAATPDPASDTSFSVVLEGLVSRCDRIMDATNDSTVYDNAEHLRGMLREAMAFAKVFVEVDEVANDDAVQTFKPNPITW